MPFLNYKKGAIPPLFMLYLWKYLENMSKITGIYLQYTPNHKTDGTKTGKANAQLVSGQPICQRTLLQLTTFVPEIPESSKPQQQ